jgi:hypothetical protein
MELFFMMIHFSRVLSGNLPNCNLGVVVCHRMKGREAEAADSIIGLSTRFGEEAGASLLTLPTGYAYVETTRAPLQLVHMAANERELVSRMEVRARGQDELTLAR